MLAPSARPKPISKTAGVFALENWAASLTNRETVRPVLELTERQAGIPFILRKVRGRDDFVDYIAQWAAGYPRYGIGYFGCHGGPGTLQIGGDTFSVRELGEELSDRRVSLRKRTIYFSSCSVLAAPKKEMEQFLADTGAAAVCGYAHPDGVGWLESAAFELLLLESLASTVKRSAPYALRDFVKHNNRLKQAVRFKYLPVPPTRTAA